MKFLLFADYHHYPEYYLNHGIEGIRKFQRIAEEKGCDMILHLGDFCHGALTVKEFVDEYNNFHIPSYHCLGNHDTELCTREEVLEAYKMPNDYYFFDKCGYRFIIVNTNYFYDRDNDEYIPFNQTNYYGAPERETIPPEEIEWIKESIESSPYPCIICSHASFERLDSVKNREEIIKIIDEANRKKPKSVIMCMNGHHHKDHIAIMNNVIYYDVTSSTFDIAWSPPRAPHTMPMPPAFPQKRMAMILSSLTRTRPRPSIWPARRSPSSWTGTPAPSS